MATKIWLGDDSGNEGDYGVANNWSPSGVPIAADDVFFVNSSQDVTGTLDQSGVLLGSFTIRSNYTGTIGTESAFLQIQTPTADLGSNIGSGTPAGSKRLNLDFGSVTAVAIVVTSTATTAADTNREPLRLLTANAGSTLFVISGKVAVADEPSQASTLTSADISDGDLSLGAGLTITTLNITGGTARLNSAATTINIDGGTVETAGSGAVTTVNVNGGTINSNSTGTITAINARAGTTDFLGSQQTRTVTTVTLSRGAQLNIDTGVVTLTNDIQLDGLDPVTIRVN